MFTKGYSRLVALCACVMLAGCATSRSEIALHSPAVVAPAATAMSAQHVVVIGKITDERAFEDAPSDPSTPSLGFGGAGKATDDVKARAVARKRNGYGMAMGDVLLQPGHTVESVVRENLVAAFQQAGYEVKSEGDAGASPLVVDVRIKQFWAWFDPGFWAITLNNNVVTDLVVNGVSAPIVVSTHVEEKRQAATDDAWVQIVDKGMDAYRAEVSHRLQGSDGATIAAAAVNAQPAPASVTTAPMPAAPSYQPAAPVASAAAPSAAVSPVADTPSTPAPSVSPAVAVAASADTSMAQDAATQLGCGAVQANGNSTFVAPCDGYSVLIDCDGGQCRPMHTIKAKEND
jgi:hypothetical protein